MKKERKNPLSKSFGYAFEGILTGIRQERNMRIHCMAVILVTAAGTLFQITAVEWCVCLLLFALVAGLEGWMLRRCSAVERIILIVSSPFLLLPGVFTDAAGAAGIAAVCIYQWMRRNHKDKEIETV
jgi:diacylglycerol kinase